MGQSFVNGSNSFKEEPVSRPHIVMRKIRDVLRLTIGEGLSLRQVGASLHIPVTTAGDYVRRARNAGLTWPLPDDLDDDALESVLCGYPDPAPPQIRPMPDWAKIHFELRRPHVTRLLLWHEYKGPSLMALAIHSSAGTISTSHQSSCPLP